MRGHEAGERQDFVYIFKWPLQLLRGEEVAGRRAEPGMVCAVVQARGVAGVGKVVAGKMEAGDILEAEQL